MKLSLVVPCYNEAEAIPLFYDAVKALSLSVDLEFVFVDDGSKDGSLTVMRDLASRAPEVRYVSFSRNFGKEAALLAGLRESSGDTVVTLDVDLQHPVTLLPEMIAALDSGEYDCVAAQRVTREGEPVFRSLFSRAFYALLNRLSSIEVRSGETDYRMMTRQVVDAVLSLQEVNRFTKGIYAWVGFRTKWLTFENVARSAGTTKWSFWGLLKYSFEGITAFSTVPLQLASVVGLLCCLSAFIYMTYIVIKAIVVGDPVSGWPTLTCLILLLGGIQLLVVGILGTYLAKLYLETKHRPVYLIRERRSETK